MHIKTPLMEIFSYTSLYETYDSILHTYYCSVLHVVFVSIILILPAFRLIKDNTVKVAIKHYMYTVIYV